MDIKRCSKNRAETSEGKMIILRAEFHDFRRYRVFLTKWGVSGVTFSVDIRRYKFCLISNPHAKVMHVLWQEL